MWTLTELPIVQAPMAGSQGPKLCIAVCEAGGLGSIPCAMLTPDVLRAQVAEIRAATRAPFNVNFFAHRPPAPDPAREAAWVERLSGYYSEFGLDPASLLLRWVATLPDTRVVLGTANPHRLPDAVRACSEPLPRDAWYALYEAARGVAVP